MSTKIYTTQKSRPYKVEVFGLQDDFIGTLQSFADLSIGRVQDPRLTLSGDGTQEFTCSIPRFYINPKTNEKIINPRWEDIKNGVLAENTRVLKVFVIEEGEVKVYPFIVDKIIDKRDSHFSVYKEITASGLAFAELGKTGLRLELNKDVVEADYKKDNNTVATLDYWLDKVFPRDESGHWLTPWSYEIRMDWSNYSDAAQRETNKMYDDIQVTKWDVVDGKLIPAETSVLQEKARYIDSDKGSNKYNITQTIAETFGIFCIYEYKCEANGQFVKTYYDEEKKCYMTGRTAVFYNRAIKTDNPFTLDYQKNLQSISRTCDSTEVYTKLFVDPIQSDTMTDGYVTIANTEANPLMDEFILNFDYLYSKGSITEYQKNFIDEYSIEIHKINETLRNHGERINLLTVEINDKKAEKAVAEKSISAIQEELTHYQTLRDNDVTNTPVIKDKNNSYSVVFVKDKEKTYYTASIRLEGVLSGSINGYDTYEYKNTIFTSDNLVSSQDYKPVLETDPNMYIVLDEDGYATGLYTSNAKWFETDDIENSYSLNAGYMIYLALQYSPHNKYIEVCDRFERMIAKKEEAIMICDSIIENKQTELDALIAEQTELLTEKDLLNQKLERIMGPALREGHWPANEYEDIGRKSETTVKAGNAAVDNVSLIFDTELFDGEEKGYYYTSVEDASNDIRTYYDYIDISSYITNWKDKNPEDLVIHLIHPEFNYTVTESQYEGLAAGGYFILYNMTKYYFTLPQTLITGDKLRLYPSSKTDLLLQMSADKGVSWSTINFEEKDEEKYYANLSDAFENLNKYLGTYKIYPNAGFVYAFALKDDGTVKPILLFNNPEINYSIYKRIGYSFDTEEIIEAELHNNRIYGSKFTICYPRIVIAKNNVNYNDDLLTITEEGAEKALTKFEDYSVLLRNGWPRFNLKVTESTTPYALLNKKYTIVYRVSQANEMLYRDALEVARENSRPRFSYDVSIAQLPNTVESYELGQLGYINDNALGVKAAKGYINQITLVLDSPKDDEIQIQNYKTKFEDLFATITASSEAMKSNQQSYDIAASIINPSTGGIQGSILQDSFNNNKVELTYSKTQVHIDDTDGITLTNTEPYSNGVYGQVVMRGGGIYLSNQIDGNYERIWSTGITPNGINASMITTGQLDANLIRIFAGNNVAFQWNSEGIYAYKRDENNQFLSNTYVRYSDKGLQYLDNGFTAVDLGWNGLAINTQGGSLTLTGKDGLVVYDGLQNDSENPTNHLIKIGRFEEDENVSYGMKLYKPITIGENTSYTETLITSNDGHLWLKDYIEVGNKTNSDDGVSIYGAGISGIANSEDSIISGGGANLGGSSGSINTGGAGLSGVGDPNKSVRFWAGSSFDSRDAAPFRVLQDGTCYATSLYIGGNSSINGSSVNDITEVMNNYNSKLFSSNGMVYNRDIITQTILFCSATKNGIEIAGLPDGYLLTLEYCERSSGEWFTKQTSLGERFNVTVDMDENYSYRSVLKYTNSKGELQVIFGDVITFIAVSDGEQGDSIDKVDEWYAASNSMSVTPTDWKDSLRETDFSQDNPYLWVKEVYVYTNGTSSEPMYRIMAVYGQNGVGIEKITNYYAITNLKTGVEIGTTFWYAVGPDEEYKDIPTTTAFNRYLWHYEKITFTDGSVTTTSPRIIAVQGTSITGVTNQYILSTSKLEILDESGNIREEEDWKNSYEEIGSPSAIWPYVWSREVISYDDGSDPKILSARLIATYGDGIVEIQEYYQLANTNLVNELDNTKWGEPNPTEVPVPHKEAKFLWNKEKQIFTDGASRDTQPRIIGMYGEVGAQGEEGRSVVSIIEEYVLSDDGIHAPAEGWDITFISPTKDLPYLWNREGILYSDQEDYEYSNNPAIIATYVEDGRGITNLENYYCTYHLTSGVEAGINKEGYTWEGPEFPDGIPVPDKEKPYLWNYELIYWTDGSTTQTDACIVGTLGIDGISVEDIEEEYAISSNKEEAPALSEWSKDIKSPTKEKPYLWVKETIKYNENSNKDNTVFTRIISTYSENGRSVSRIENWYTLTTDEVIITKNDISKYSWSATPGQTDVINRYLWNYEKIFYKIDNGEGGYIEDISNPEIIEPRVIGIHGIPGKDGRGVDDVIEYYQYTAENIQPDSNSQDWKVSLPSYNPSKPYLWIKEVVTYNVVEGYDSNTKEFIRLISVSGQVKDIINYYLINKIDNAEAMKDIPLPGQPNSKWTTEEQDTNPEERFLWNYEVITYTVPDVEGNSSKAFGPRLIGVHGVKGDTGAAGISVENIIEYYGLSKNVETQPADSDWDTKLITPTEEKPFLWCKEIVEYDQNKPNEEFIRIIGTYSKDGRSIVDIKNYYWANNLNNPPSLDIYPLPPNASDTWTEEEQLTSTEKPYLWNCEVISYDKAANGEEANTPTILGPRLIGTQGKDGNNGAPGRDIEQIEEQYARNNSVIETPSNWSSTFEVPDPDNQYLWAREKITYSTDTNKDGIKDVEYTKPRIISSYVEGGRGIERIDNYYLASSKSSGVAKEDITKDYDSQRKLLSTDVPYLWSVEKIIYTAGDPSYTTPFIAAYYSITTYTWIKYADDANGTNMSDSPIGKTYMGIAYNQATSQESTNATKYSWSLIKGADGLPGAPGKNGITYYTWIKYGVDKIGTSMVDDPNNLPPGTTYEASDYIYIGIAYGKTTSTESQNASDYTWSLFQGPQGLQGPTGNEGRGIKQIQEYYLRTNSTIPPTDGNSGWRDELIPEEHTLIPTSQYLWMKEVVTYTDATTKVFKHIIATYAPSGINGRGIDSIVNYYKKTSSTTAPTFSKDNPTNNGWQTSLIVTDTSNKYLWNVELITWKEADGTTTKTNTAPRIISTHGATGSAGTNAINYRLQLNATSVTKKLANVFSPSAITCSVSKIAETTTPNINIADFSLKVQKRNNSGILSDVSVTKNTTTNKWTISLTSTMLDAEAFILTLTNSSGTITYDTFSISCVISDELKELAAIDEDKEVYIKDGKVRATSIAAYAVTAGKIAAGAIETGGIAAGSELYLYTAGEDQTLASLPVYGGSWTDPVTNTITTITNISDYNSAIHTTLNYNYDYSTGGKMKLSSSGVEIKNQDSELIVSPDIISGTKATFKSLQIDGREVFGGANIVVSSETPNWDEVKKPALWFQPVATTSIECKASTGSSRTANQILYGNNWHTWKGGDKGTKLIFNSAAGLPENTEVTYTLTFPIGCMNLSKNLTSTVEVELYLWNEEAPFVTFSETLSYTKGYYYTTFISSVSGKLNTFFTDENLENLSEEQRTITMRYRGSGTGLETGTWRYPYLNSNGYITLSITTADAAMTGKVPCSVYYFPL